MSVSFRWSAVLALWLVASPLRAELRVDNICANYGRFGPSRNNLTLAADDEVYFCFDILGIKTDDEGHVQGRIRVEITNESGKIVREDESPIKGKLVLGGQRLPGSAYVSFEKKVPPGEYTVAVTVHDSLGGEKVSFRRSVVYRNEDLAIVSPQFFYDAEGKLPAPLRGVVGQALHFRLKAVNVDKSKGKLHAVMTMRALDAEGNEMLHKPFTAVVKEDDPNIVKQATHLSFKGFFSLHRPGDFELKLTVTDQLGSESSTVTFPLHIEPLHTPARH